MSQTVDYPKYDLPTTGGDSVGKDEPTAQEIIIKE